MREINQKGQVTIFIVLAIVIVGLIVLFFVFKDKISLSSETNLDESEMIESIENCVSESLIDGSRLIGLQGGYLELPQKYVKLNSSNVAYGYYLGTNTLNQKSRIENEISSYIELILPYCFDETQFPEYVITENEVDSQVEINGRGISTSTKFSISATKEDSSFTIDKKFNSEVPIRLDSIYNVAEEIINKEIENPEVIGLTYLADLDYSISVIPYNEEVIIYSISDTNPENPDYYYTFMFANKIK